MAAVIAVAAVPLAAAPADAAPTSATAARYKNCAMLNRDYPNGVGKRGAKDKVSGRAKANPVRSFKVDSRLYASLPKTLDRDRDGIACEKHTGRASTSSRPTTRPAAPKATIKGRVITTSGPIAFVSPSGNIMCMGSSNLRCDITQRNYRAPQRPSWCDLDWGNGFALGRTAAFLCAGDTIMGTAPASASPWFARTGVKPFSSWGSPQAVLPYGWTLRNSSFSCASAKTGVTCTNTTTRRGFTVSKDRYRLF
ncbi:hypothetical protein GCM10025883_30110 [Mobilicoccus caccae]|uniref:Excalibur calcium-binding domain-containing protein n=2 Tax=Mobilicoccus caccae TaxID=1859295 RepID=A0ABQ6IV86_9MICO|nr:hypothetical protein GCM10025883_30110 [Mobilicoccus caccae]